MTLDRKDYKTSIPQLEKRLSAVEGVGKKGLANFDILQDLINKEILERERQILKTDTSINTITVKMYYLVCNTGVTPTPETQGWSETMPKMDSTNDDKVLWYMSKTFRNGAVVKTSTPQMVQIMDGVFAFINSVSGDDGWTTIDGDTIETGRIQDHTGDNYFDLDDGTFNFGDENGNYVRQVGNGVEINGKLTVGSFGTLQIGGRNLLPTSKNLKLFALETTTYMSKTVTNDYLAVTRLSGNNTSNYGVFYDIQVEANTDYVLSVDVSGVSGNTLRNAIGHMAPAGTGKSSWTGCAYYEFITADGRYVRKFNTDVTTTARVYFAMQYVEGASNTIQLSNIKLEKGNKATDWTPAPEDIQSEIDAKKSVHTLMASSSGSTYANILAWTAEGITESWYINTSATPLTNVKIGDTCRVAYKVTDMNNAYVYVVGEVTAIYTGSIGMKMHGLDTTIIDGGNILTNSIGANQIKANAITIGKINTSDADTKSGLLNSAIEIGGHNLLPVTHMFTGNQRNVSNANSNYERSVSNNRGVTLCHTSDILAELAPSSAGSGEDIVLSFDFKIDSGGTASHNIRFYPYQSNGISINGGRLLTDAEKTTSWKRVVHYCKAHNFGDNGSYTTGSIYIYDETGNNYFSIRNVQIERGNKVTDFSPCSEDNGRNLLLNSRKTLSGLDGSSRYFKIAEDIPANSDITLSVIINASSITWSNTSSYYRIGMELSNPKASSGTQYMGCWAYKSGASGGSNAANITGTSFSDRISFTWKNETAISAGKQVGVYIQGVASGSVAVSYPKIEYGKYASPYEDSPQEQKTYITEINDSGIFISPSNQSPTTNSTGNSVRIDGDGMKVYKSGIAVAQYGESAIIGKESAAHSVIDSDGQRFYASNGTTQLANIGYASGSSASGTATAPYYDFGVRKSGTTKGNYSVAEGGETTASGYVSHSQNMGTIASKTAQTAIGTYNIEDTSTNDHGAFYRTGLYAFIIGNGTNITRSNAFTVTWKGNVEASGEIHGALATPTISISTSTGSLQASSVRRQGNFVHLLLTIKKTSATNSGANVYEGTINTTGLRPVLTATGGTYFGSYALNGTIATDGTIVVRNADSRQLAAMSSNGNISFTYLVN